MTITYESASERLTGRCQQRRKLSNNTYLCRRTDSIALQYHATDVLTWNSDGSVTLDSGGWLTLTTKQRLNEFGPARVHQDKGRWYVSYGGETYAYADGMTLHSDGSVTGAMSEATAKMQDRAANVVKRRVRKFVNDITAEHIVQAWENSGGDCFICRFGQTDCLTDHLAEGYFHATLAHNAIKARHYGNPDLVMQMIYGDAQRGRVSDLLTDSLAKYLRANLVEGLVTR